MGYLAAYFVITACTLLPIFGFELLLAMKEKVNVEINGNFTRTMNSVFKVSPIPLAWAFLFMLVLLDYPFRLFLLCKKYYQTIQGRMSDMEHQEAEQRARM